MVSNLAYWLVNGLKFTCIDIVMLTYLEAKIATKSNLLVSILSNFPGSMPPDPLKQACYACFYAQVITKNWAPPTSSTLLLPCKWSYLQTKLA